MFKSVFANQLSRKHWKCLQAREWLKRVLRAYFRWSVEISCIASPSRPSSACASWWGSLLTKEIHGNWGDTAQNCPQGVRVPLLRTVAWACLSCREKWVLQKGELRPRRGVAVTRSPTGHLAASVIKLWFIPLRGLLCLGQCSEPSRQCPLFSR